MSININMMLTCDECGYVEQDTYSGDEADVFKSVEHEAEILGFEFYKYNQLLCSDCTSTDNDDDDEDDES